jgi:plastocyanin domain-containing protein
VLLLAASLIRGIAAVMPVTSPPNEQMQPYIPDSTSGMQMVDLSWGVLNYKPEVIEVKAGIPVRINADMNRLRGCYRSFMIHGMGVVGTFTDAKPYLDFFPEKKGEYTFSCTMNMASGKLIVS